MGTTETKPTTADLDRLLSEITPGPWKMGRFEGYECDGTPFRRVYFGSGEAHITGADCDQNARAALTQPTGEPK